MPIHSIGHIRFLISLLFQQCLCLEPFLRYCLSINRSINQPINHLFVHQSTYKKDRMHILNRTLKAPRALTLAFPLAFYIITISLSCTISETERYWLKIADFNLSHLIWRPLLGLTPIDVFHVLYMASDNRSLGYRIVCVHDSTFSLFGRTLTVIDRRTDGKTDKQTDRAMAYTALSWSRTVIK